MSSAPTAQPFSGLRALMLAALHLVTARRPFHDELRGRTTDALDAALAAARCTLVALAAAAAVDPRRAARWRAEGPRPLWLEFVMPAPVLTTWRAFVDEVRGELFEDAPAAPTREARALAALHALAELDAAALAALLGDGKIDAAEARALAPLVVRAMRLLERFLGSLAPEVRLAAERSAAA